MLIDQEARMKVLATALTILSFSAGTAAAQFTINPAPQAGGAFGVDPILRVTSSFRKAVTLGPTQTVPDPAEQAAARRELYAMAADECASLAEIFKSECRLSSVQMFAPVGAAAAPPNVVTVTAVYELRPLRTPGR
jgi:hypothetical protein